ncbi:nucleoporin protein Ndc1-Nup protein [Citrus sinensis]|uniref:Nucleoporin protein Ndc1-Nup protein n=1 Tax=Citrus sinensis TaxID=2711 RepID=A0ACB8M5F3_CITSI|nr:nucleoporin protein Ndc1-Nup protein [Citrus sinensis]
MSSSPVEPETVVKNRHLGFLIWQSIPSTAIFLLFKLLVLSPRCSILTFLLTLSTFHVSQLAFSSALSFASSPPQPKRPVPPLRLAFSLLSSWSPDFRRRAVVSFTLMLFVAVAAASGFLSVASVCWLEGFDGVELFWRVGFRGFVCGLLYAFFYVYKQRWVLEFPIIQRPPFFSFKMSLPSAIKKALKLSGAAYLFSALPVVFLADQLKSEVAIGKFISEQITFYIGTFAVFLCWELDHHLHQVLHTKRFMFAPPKGSAAAETNPSEPLLAALEESTPSSLLQYLAYLDLCMVCENNVDTWRRAAFFEETSETYRRVINVSLKPLKQLATKLGEGMEAGSVDKDISNQLLSPTDMRVDSKYSEELNNFQMLAKNKGCGTCAPYISYELL